MITNEINKKPHGMMADVEQTQIRMSGRCSALLNERKMDATFGLLTALELLGITTPCFERHTVVGKKTGICKSLPIQGGCGMRKNTGTASPITP